MVLTGILRFMSLGQIVPEIWPVENLDIPTSESKGEFKYGSDGPHPVFFECGRKSVGGPENKL